MTPKQKFELVNHYLNHGFRIFYCPEDVFYEIIACREYHLLGYAIKVQHNTLGACHYRLERVDESELKYLAPVEKP